jgi:hypothetical protein
MQPDGRLQTFWRNLPSPSSGQMKMEAGGSSKMVVTITRLHSVTSQKTAVFLINTVKFSNLLYCICSGIHFKASSIYFSVTNFIILYCHSK